MTNTYILTFSCKDTTGIVATVSQFIFKTGGFVIESGQFGDPFTKMFFFRSEFSCAKKLSELEKVFTPIAKKFKMNFGIHDKNKKQKLLIAVSKSSHCLSHLLHKHEVGALNADIVGVVSNHKDLKQWADRFGIKYFHLPSEKQVMALHKKLQPDVFILARYMQILSDSACDTLKGGKAINIHHSFLPGFKGAKPYHQAYDRGVKIIGATAHYVTKELDEGPIIEQEVTRVDHNFSPNDLKLTGEDIEAQVLFRAVKWHLEHRVIINGSKTVIFK